MLVEQVSRVKASDYLSLLRDYLVIPVLDLAAHLDQAKRGSWRVLERVKRVQGCVQPVVAH